MTKAPAHDLPETATAREVLDYWLARLPRTPQPLVRGTRGSSRTSRAVVRLPARAGLTATWILWPPGSAVPLHDHAGASRVAILHGTLTEIVRDANGELRARRNWTDQQQVEIPAGQQHEVRNLSNATASTLHVYEPAEAALNFHSPAARGGRAGRSNRPTPR